MHQKMNMVVKRTINIFNDHFKSIKIFIRSLDQKEIELKNKYKIITLSNAHYNILTKHKTMTANDFYHYQTTLYSSRANVNEKS